MKFPSSIDHHLNRFRLEAIIIILFQFFCWWPMSSGFHHGLRRTWHPPQSSSSMAVVAAAGNWSSAIGQNAAAGFHLDASASILSPDSRYPPSSFVEGEEEEEWGKRRHRKEPRQSSLLNPKPLTNENNILIKEQQPQQNMVLSPTYRKLKFKRKLKLHHKHATVVEEVSAVGPSQPTTPTPVLRRYQRKRMASRYVPRVVVPGFTPSLPIYGPSLLHIDRIKILPPNGPFAKVTKVSRTRRIKLKRVKSESNGINTTAVATPAPNFQINEIARDPRPKISIRKLELFDQDLPETAAEASSFDILRNDIPKSTEVASTTPKHLRRSLPNFMQPSISSPSIQMPPGFRSQSSSFGQPAPRPSHYHWSYNPNTTVLPRGFSIKPLSSFPVQPAILVTSAPRRIPFQPVPVTTTTPAPPVHFPTFPHFAPAHFATTTTTTTTTTTPRPAVSNFRSFSATLPLTAPAVVSAPRTRTNSGRSRSRKKQSSSGVNQAERCTEEKCRLPFCRCGSSLIPGGMKPEEIPQLVMITFDDAVNELNWDLFNEIFSNRYNPNGCPILGTFYVSHEWTDYSHVQNLYASGHEMASHTITHSFGDKFSKDKWLNEVNGEREILHLYGGVRYDDVRGMRAPFLQPGGNNQFEMLHEANFTYDSSLPVFENNPPYWPYTFDYAMSHECMISPCPTRSFPGLWEVGMVMLIDHRGGRCSMVDACSHPATEEEVFENLLKNFNRHYHSNKAPFGLYFHSAWFNTQHFRRGFLRFLDHISQNKDVYFVTKWQLIQWMMNPTPITRLKSFVPFHCDYSDRQPCYQPKVCSTSFRDGPRYLKTCQKCPKNYPWLGKTGFKK